VDFGDGAFDDVKALDLDDIDEVVPGAAVCFEPQPLPPLLSRWQTEIAPVVEPPAYLSMFPASWTDFWNADQDGSLLSPYGCFPVGCEPL
ncbi:hypothetical protein Q0P46_13780, partial [Staphylococcus aureus]|nr:hypothetical protein [Staphylococcus aureus]